MVSAATDTDTSMNMFVRENIGVSDLDEQRSWLVC